MRWLWAFFEGICRTYQPSVCACANCGHKTIVPMTDCEACR